MGTVVLNGATSGSTTLTPTDAVTATFTLPSSTGTLVTTASPTFTGTATIPTATVTTLNTPSGVLATQNGMNGIAKAWAQFNSSGTINGSFNVSSITVNGTGWYTVNLTTAMSNANYSAIATTSASTGSNGNICATVFTNNSYADVPPTTTAYNIVVGVYGVGPYATRYITTAVFGS